MRLTKRKARAVRPDLKRFVRNHHVLLKRFSPKKFRLCHRLALRCRLEFEVTFLVNLKINSPAAYTLVPDPLYRVFFTRPLISDADDEYLSYILVHEIGHLVFPIKKDPESEMVAEHFAAQVLGKELVQRGIQLTIENTLGPERLAALQLLAALDEDWASVDIEYWRRKGTDVRRQLPKFKPDLAGM